MTMTSSAAFLKQLLTDQDKITVSGMELTEQPTVLNALSTVINFVISDAFSLSSEESMWVGYQLGIILQPLEHIIPTTIAIAVDQEMRTREYSNRMMDRDTVGSQKPQGKGVQFAPIEDWVDSFSEVILFCYPKVRPLIKSGIIGQLHGLLSELGLTGSAKTSRGSTYLPNAVRYRLKSDED